MENKPIRYSFSGHETFHCKSLWLKKGYDFMAQSLNFNTPESVVALGVGKNMVASIRFWLRAFGLCNDNDLTYISNYIFDNNDGCDPFAEDSGTLWMLQYLLVNSNIASIYKLCFVDFHAEKNDFTKEQFQGFIKRKCSETDNPNMYNDNTIWKDINVLLQNYVTPINTKPNEDSFALLSGLNLIRQTGFQEDSQEHKKPLYSFNVVGKQCFVPEILLYAIIDRKGESKSVSYESLYELSLLFCLSPSELIDTIKILESQYSTALRFTDDGGIKQLLFIEEIDKMNVLDKYYNKK